MQKSYIILSALDSVKNHGHLSHFDICRRSLVHCRPWLTAEGHIKSIFAYHIIFVLLAFFTDLVSAKLSWVSVVCRTGDVCVF